jgi:flagellar assembly protein FliH
MKDPKTDILSEDNTSPDQLSAWARWQLPNMDADAPAKHNAFNIAAQKRRKGELAAELEPEPEIKPPTLEEIEAIRQAAYAEGREEGRAAGHEEGYKDGFKRGESDLKAAVTRVGQIARVLLEPIPQQDDELESAVLQLVENICKRVVQRELSVDSSGLRKVVSSALECLNTGAQRIRVHLNPVDCEMITAHLRAMSELEDNWRVVPHPTITPGGCIVETDNSLIDARAEKRLAAVIQQVFERQQQALEESSQQQRGMDQLLGEVAAFAVDDVTPHEDDSELDEDDPFHVP